MRPMTKSRNHRITQSPDAKTCERMLYYLKLTRAAEERIERVLYRQGKIVGGVYVGAAALLNAVLFLRSLQLYRRPDTLRAKSLFKYSMVYLALTYDHRLVDGADAARFLTTVKERLEEGAFEAELGL